MEERLAFSSKQTEAAQRDAQDWKKRYENIMNDYNRASENSAAQYSTLQKKVTSLEERRTVLGTQLEGAKKEAADWQSKFESFFAARRAEEERLNSEIASLQVFYNWRKSLVPWTMNTHLSCCVSCTSMN